LFIFFFAIVDITLHTSGMFDPYGYGIATIPEEMDFR